MDSQITRREVRTGIVAMARALISHADELSALDAATGDGDLGVSIRIGSQAVIDDLDSADDVDLSALFSRSGMAFNRAAGSTIGALIATAGLRAAKEVEGATEIDLPLLAQAVSAAADAIAQRGKARAGDKTLLDALMPAAEALREAAESGLSMRDAGETGLAAARSGMEQTRDMQSQVGRGKWVGERTVGHIDAGAAVVVLAIGALLLGEDASRVELVDISGDAT